MQQPSPARPSQRAADATLLVFTIVVLPCLAALLLALYVTGHTL
jgi:hypothetical protein